MKNVKKFFLLSCAIYCTACSGNGNTGNSDGQDIPKVDDSQLAYHNPVIRIAAPDPTAMRAKDGYFYLYATEDIRNLPELSREIVFQYILILNNYANSEIFLQIIHDREE